MDLALSLDRNSTIPLYQQLAEELRGAVLQKRLKPNQQLPPSRLLAQSLDISRVTVTQSYDQLVSEGYLETRKGSGTFVCAQLPEDYLQIEPIAQNSSPSSAPTRLSQFGTQLLAGQALEGPCPQSAINFRYGNPASELFPMDLWRRLLTRHCSTSSSLMNYSADAAGYLPLRQAIADYLGRSRAVQCSPEQVIIVNGSQQALDLIARLTLDAGDWVAMEDPGYLGARYCFAAQGANLQPIPVDEEGVDVAALAQYPQSFKLLYVTPSHQFPTGVTLSLSRRLALLQWAQQTGTLILEDDYDGEYRYGDRPIPALQGLDRNNTVIYVGTFSKILFPALRIGYLVVPKAWIPLVSRAKWLCDRQSPLLEQYALADFFTEGHFDRHIRRMRHLYNQQRQALVNVLKESFDSRITILGENAGIHLMAKLETPIPDEAVIQRAASVDVGVISAQSYYLASPKTGEFIFGYAQLDEDQIQQGIQALAQVLKA
ncbi:PLP-dependent aminotransferase family protein [Halomicronema hongdechloris C2206]|uniref:PLP-dependent aminotransferase family protein n=1 Tax=Halomicronema hongdechloris C2206 TaxID=1641165 RepID=A0A1Z3HQK1_9CYAN|nr:PLP-dependent aminotransferase family protein [Halomicronema hongdechloris]ASC72583.1 PLP-dependent aminotransferase family protein [Halomicronema hongdechloris C2206]